MNTFHDACILQSIHSTIHAFYDAYILRPVHSTTHTFHDAYIPSLTEESTADGTPRHRVKATRLKNIHNIMPNLRSSSHSLLPELLHFSHSFSTSSTASPLLPQPLHFSHSDRHRGLDLTKTLGLCASRKHVESGPLKDKRVQTL